MALFSSDHERRLWRWMLLVLLAILASLFLAESLAGTLASRGFAEALFAAGMLLVLAAVVTHGVTRRPRGVEVAVLLGVAAAYLLLFTRMSTAAERTHLLEYGVVAVLAHEALRERRHRGRRVPAPALIAIGATAAFGCLDESLQLFLPNRVFDPFDMLVNVLAATAAVTSSAAISWARGRSGPGD